MKITFTTIVKPDGNNTGLEVPAEVIATLGTSKKPPVIVSLAGFTYHTTVAVRNGIFMLSLSKANREAAGVKAGDQVEVILEPDLAPRTVAVPDDLAAALAKKPGAQIAFDTLSYTYRKEAVRQVESAKAADTRARRIAGIVSKLGNE